LREGRKLHYNEITDRVLKTGLTKLGTKGKTPEMTINGLLTTTKWGVQKLFKSEGEGEYSLCNKLLARSIPEVQEVIRLMGWSAG